MKNTPKPKTAKRFAKFKAAPSSVTITYDLFDLPTAQHKAGLAGLLMQIESMRQRHVTASWIPAVHEVTANTATITFTEESTQGLFDDLYDATFVDVESANKSNKATPKAEKTVKVTDPKTGKTKEAKRFVYEVMQPRGAFLEQQFGSGTSPWLKLWRDMLWAVPRSKPTTRGPYQDRANERPCREGKAAWQLLLKWEAARTQGRAITDSVSSALLLGAQAASAESVPFNGLVQQNLLLHFWALACLTYVPERITQEGETKYVGYTLVIPEVSDLQDFIRQFPRLLAGLKRDVCGYRPAEAVISLPEQGVLRFMDHLADLAGANLHGRSLMFSVASAEYHHLIQLRHNTKVATTGRLSLTAGILSEYRRIRDRYSNPLFMKARLASLLDRETWYAGMSEVLTRWPAPFFVRTESTPGKIPGFHRDAYIAFKEEVSMDTQTTSADLAQVVYRLVQQYVWRKTEARSNISYQTFKDKKDANGRIQVPAAYREAKARICEDMFLSFRSRREQDFVDYFSSTIGSVPQYLPESEYILVTQALINGRWMDVKTLAMLAVSACSN